MKSGYYNNKLLLLILFFALLISCYPAFGAVIAENDNNYSPKTVAGSAEAGVQLAAGTDQRGLLTQSGDVTAVPDGDQKTLDSHSLDNQPVRLGEIAKEMGDLLASAGRHSEALDQYGKAAGYYAKAEFHLGAGNVHFIIGELFLKQAQQEKALLSFETALEFYTRAADPLSQGNALLRIGEVVVRKGEYVRSFAAYTKALACYERSGDIVALANIRSNLVNLATIMGDSALRKGKYPEALDHFNKGLEYAGNDTSEAALLLRKKGSALIMLKETDLAVKSIAAALSVYEKNQDLAASATTYKMLGDFYLREGKYPDAAECFARAESLYRMLGDRQGRGNALRGSGDASFFRGETGNALKNYWAALDLFTTTHDVKGQAAIFRVLGEIHMQQGANTKALELYGKALVLFEQSGDIPGMKVIYRCQADVLMRTGDNARALELQAKAEALTGNADNMIEKAGKARLQADIYFRAGDNTRAMEWYGEALTLYRKSGNLSGEGDVIRSLGDVYVNKGEYTLALKQYELALPIVEKAGDQTGQGNIFQMQGSIAYMQGNNGEALKQYTKAHALFEICRNKLGLVNVKKSQADLYASQHDFAKAKPLYQSVLAFYTDAGNLEAQAYTLFGMAQIAVREGLKKDALHLYEDALALLEKIRKQTGYSGLKKSFMEKTYELYEEAVVFMIRNDYTVEAMRNAESMKARVFIDQLAEGQVVIKNGEPSEAKEQREALETEIAAMDHRISDLARSGDNGALLDSLGKSRNEAERKLDSLNVNIRVNNPLYASVHYPEPVLAQELQKNILRSDETLLEFFVSAEGVYCFVVTVNSLAAVKLPLTRKELDQMAKALLDAIAKGPSRTSRHFEDVATALYERLLAPMEKMIRNNTVIIVPDGILARVPFEILYRMDNNQIRSFLEMNPIKYFQSATLLALQRTKFRKEKFSNSFIGFGDPVYDSRPAGGQRSEVSPKPVLTPSDTALIRLEASGKEILEISEIFELDNRGVKILLRENANRKQAMSESMKEYGFIHFAAHGIKYAGYQAIALSPLPSAADNGMLTINDIMGSSYEKSRVVVLSACQSGLGTFDRGEGVTGLTRAVMYSGSPAAVVSLWNVADSATMGLMETFYDNIVSKNMKIDQALRSAKLTMIKSGRYYHPIFWGAFVMYGE